MILVRLRFILENVTKLACIIKLLNSKDSLSDSGGISALGFVCFCFNVKTFFAFRTCLGFLDLFVDSNCNDCICLVFEAFLVFCTLLGFDLCFVFVLFEGLENCKTLDRLFTCFISLRKRILKFDLMC